MEFEPTTENYEIEINKDDQYVAFYQFQSFEENMHKVINFGSFNNKE